MQPGLPTAFSRRLSAGRFFVSRCELEIQPRPLRRLALGRGSSGIPYLEWIWDTRLSAFVGNQSLWATSAWLTIPAGENFIWYGLFWGFCLLVNPALGAVLPFLLIWIYFGGVPRTRGAACRYSAGCLPGNPRLPSLDRFATLSSSIGLFRSARISHSNCGWETIRFSTNHSRQLNRITRYEEVHQYSELGETAYLEKKGEPRRNLSAHIPRLPCNLRQGARWRFGWELPRPWRDFQRADSNLARFVLYLERTNHTWRLRRTRLSFFARRWLLLPVAAFHWRFHWSTT